MNTRKFRIGVLPDGTLILEKKTILPHTVPELSHLSEREQRFYIGMMEEFSSLGNLSWKKLIEMTKGLYPFWVETPETPVSSQPDSHQLDRSSTGGEKTRVNQRQRGKRR